MFNFSEISRSLKNFCGAIPFDHCVVDGFFDREVALELSKEFPCYSSSDWHHYSNAIEEKKTLNNWNIFPNKTYMAFNEFFSANMLDTLSKSTGVELLPDFGLHGGGWHIHKSGGNLNPHLDYSIHPKLKKQRKLNIIVYLSEELLPEHGGHLGLWHQKSENRHGKLELEIAPVFNRAVIFDTTQNSWHGMSRSLTQPENIYRKSLAVYYLCEPKPGAPKREKALFSPSECQESDDKVLELIKKRSDTKHSKKVYITK